MNCHALNALLLDPDAAAAPLPAAAEAHLEGCQACQEQRASLARLDLLLASEPAPPAPQAVMRRTLEAVARRRARDLASARQQVLVLVAAAVALVAGLGLALGGWSGADLVAAAGRTPGDLVAGVTHLGDAWTAAWTAGAAAVTAALERLVGGSQALPGPPVLLLVGLAPALLLLDALLCRAQARSHEPGGVGGGRGA